MRALTEDFAVVGVLEELHTFLALLARDFPARQRYDISRLSRRASLGPLCARLSRNAGSFTTRGTSVDFAPLNRLPNHRRELSWPLEALLYASRKMHVSPSGGGGTAATACERPASESRRFEVLLFRS